MVFSSIWGCTIRYWILREKNNWKTEPKCFSEREATHVSPAASRPACGVSILTVKKITGSTGLLLFPPKWNPKAAGKRTSTSSASDQASQVRCREDGKPLLPEAVVCRQETVDLDTRP